MRLKTESVNSFVQFIAYPENRNATLFVYKELSDPAFSFMNAPKDHVVFSYLLCCPTYSVVYNDVVKEADFKSIETAINQATMNVRMSVHELSTCSDVKYDAIVEV